MCGIVVIGNYQKDVTHQKEQMKKMASLLQYRGPDEEGISITQHCLMAHRRLSIIDLKTGQQPLVYHYQDKVYRICYNGEIYNMINIKNKL